MLIALNFEMLRYSWLIAFKKEQICKIFSFDIPEPKFSPYPRRKLLCFLIENVILEISVSQTIDEVSL